MQLCTRRRSSTPSDSSPTDELGRKQFLYRRRTLVNLARSEQRIRVERLAPVDDGVALAHPLEVVDEFVDRRVRDLDLVDVDGREGKAGAVEEGRDGLGVWRAEERAGATSEGGWGWRGGEMNDIPGSADGAGASREEQSVPVMGEMRGEMPPSRSSSASCNDVLRASASQIVGRVREMEGDGPQLKEGVTAEHRPDEDAVWSQRPLDLHERPC